MKPPFGVRLAEALLDEADDDLVGYQLARVHERLGLFAERRAVAARGPEHVAGRDLRDAEARREALRLGAFAGAWRAEEDEVALPIDRPFDISALLRVPTRVRECADLWVR